MCQQKPQAAGALLTGFERAYLSIPGAIVTACGTQASSILDTL
jgi:hypothetical protein